MCEVRMKKKKKFELGKVLDVAMRLHQTTCIYCVYKVNDVQNQNVAVHNEDTYNWSLHGTKIFLLDFNWYRIYSEPDSIFQKKDKTVFGPLTVK